MISEFFINRPIFANVIAIVIVILGLVAVYVLPVAQYPDIVPPVIQVTTLSRQSHTMRHSCTATRCQRPRVARPASTRSECARH